MEVILAAVKSFDANITISGNFVLNTKKLNISQKKDKLVVKLSLHLLVQSA